MLFDDLLDIKNRLIIQRYLFDLDSWKRFYKFCKASVALAVLLVQSDLQFLYCYNFSILYEFHCLKVNELIFSFS